MSPPMKKIAILLILLFLTPLSATLFKDIFAEASPGDFSVYQNGSSATILSVHSKDLPFITFEEITLPRRVYENVKGRDLNTWIKKGCPGNTSWTVMEINIETGDISSAFCFLKNTHLDIQKEDALISSLLNLSLTIVPEENRARIGPRGNNKKDSRPFWTPSMCVNAKPRTPKKMDVYRSRWEKDLSVLSGRDIDLYILDEFPFPFWIQIHGDVGSKKMISLDSGRNLATVVKETPKMPPKFVSKLETWEEKDSFSFLLKSNRAFESYTVYLLEVSKGGNELFPLLSKYQIIDSGILKFNLQRDHLDKKLVKGKKYRLYLSYEEDGEIKSIISKDIIHWK